MEETHGRMNLNNFVSSTNEQDVIYSPYAHFTSFHYALRDLFYPVIIIFESH